LTPEGELEGFYGEKGTGPGKISSPTGLEVDAEGNVYVADGRQQKLLVYDGEGKFLREVQVSDAPLTPLIDGNRMFLTTTGAVKVLTLPDLAEVTSWGSRGRGEAEYDYPNGLSYDTQSETLFVADGNNLRVKALDPNGNMRWIFGAPPRNMVERERAFGLPSGAVHANGYIFVPDALDGVVHILDDKGTEVAQVGNMGPAEGQLEYPSAIAHMGDNRFAIAEWGNQRIQIVDIDVAAASESWKAQAGE
jgi:DNA-binding beta-propeller fold protein YncE